ncbi:sulfatase-like hydrolase/transferase [Candidatus Nomurabacteria bacterium]|nr:sulfatase-like hydrolase/transferase [Candidatus Nomurabacteria bacterium]
MKQIFDVISPPGEILEEKLSTYPAPKESYALFIFYAAAISYLELVYRLSIFKSFDGDYIFSVLFAFPAASILFFASVFTSEIKNKIIASIIIFVLIIAYGAQLIYFSIFKTPLSLYSLIGTKDAIQFWDVVASEILKNGVVVILLFVPLVLLFLFHKRLFLSHRPEPLWLLIVAFVGILSYGVSIFSVRATSESNFSQYAVYYNIAAPELSMKKLGVLTTLRLDLQRAMFGFEENRNENLAEVPSAPLPIAQANTLLRKFNMMNIDFSNLSSSEQNRTLLDMHAYFASSAPTKKNSYTDMFKGNNLIVILAESFSPYAMSPELTPTLSKMSTEGFVFNNFYNPVWGVSTSDGEYVLNTGLIPKSGVWSMLKSSKNYLPFAFGNQFKKLGYLTKAYHDHTYTYYGRDKSIPNLGYDYKGVGNGVKVKKTWPESDLEMIDTTANEYLAAKQPFATYYITVSGHREYNFYGNHMAIKNKSYVADLPYSDTAKAYIAANLELEFALKSLIEKLETAGVAENTVIAIVPDHYPYGLPEETLDELAGHKLEDNFELYKSVFILWKKGMKPVLVDEPVSPLDILPTLSNLFGLEYDSRLLAGRDVFSNAFPLVIFVNRSWITDNGRYNSTTAQADATGGEEAYRDAVNQIVADKFKYSAKILETDYYRKVISQ